MKVAYADMGRTQESQGIQRTKTFQIKTNAHAFRILSSGLYSDKIAAVLREIGCNAHDAHLEAKQKKPFEVKLPTRFDNQFYIKDWGIGLDDNEVENLYTTYFESTKQHSDEFTGAFGLGSKSPFSYVDSFTVTAVKNGTKRVYTAHIDEAGSPTVSLMHTGSSTPDWENGVMVGFSVRPDDFDKFKERAARIFRFFDPFPIIIGGDTPKPIKLTKDFGTYGFLDSQTAQELSVYGQRSYNFLQMGNVCYPLNTGNLTFKNRSSALIDFESSAKNVSSLLVRMPIGAVQVAASREELQYDDNTKDQLMTLLVDIPKNTVTELYKTYKKIKTWKELVTFRAALSGANSSLRITEAMFKAVGATKDEAETLHHYVIYHRASRLPKWDAPANKASIRYVARKSNANDFMVSITHAGEDTKKFIYPTENTVIVRGDCPNVYGRTRLALKKGDIEGAIIVQAVDSGDDTDVDLAIEELKKTFFDIDVVLSSTLDKPPSPKKIPAAIKRAGEKVVLDDQIVEFDKVPNDRKVFQPVLRRSVYGRQNTAYITKNGNHMAKWEVSGLWNSINELEPILGKVERPVQVTQNQVKKLGLASDPDWILFEDWLKVELEDPATLTKLKNKVQAKKYTVDLNYFYGNHNNDFLTIVVQLAHREKKTFDMIKPILAKEGLLADIEKVLKDSEDESKNGGNRYGKSAMEELVEAYSEVCRKVEATPNIPPVVKGGKLALASQYQAVAKLGYDMVISLGKLDPKILEHVFEFQLKKG